MTAIVLLAAGASRRMMGRDKLLEEVNGEALLRRQAMRACGTGIPVFVTLPPAPHPRYAVLKGLDLSVVPVADAQDGMNASLAAGLNAVPQDINAVMVLLADMPDITQADIETVLDAVDSGSGTLIWRATTHTGDAGHPIAFHRQLVPELIALKGDQGGKEVVRANAARTALIPLPDEHARTDLDTPEAWANWRARQST